MEFGFVRGDFYVPGEADGTLKCLINVYSLISIMSTYYIISTVRNF